jgi:HEAT repeat protein
MKARLLGGAVVVLVIAVAALWALPDLRYSLWEKVSKEKFHEGRPTSYWLDMAKGPDGPVREHALHVLGDLGKENPEAVPILIVALKDENYLNRKDAAVALGAIGPPAQAAVPDLITALKDKNVTVRRSAAVSLGQIHADPQQTIPALLAAIKAGGDGYVRSHSVDSIGDFGPEAESAIPDLANLLKDKALARHAVAALMHVGPAALPTFEQALSSPDMQMRTVAMSALASMGDKARGQAPKIVPMLKDKDPAVRIAAAEVLWRISGRTEDTIPVLIAEVTNRKQWGIRGSAIIILGKMGPVAKAAVPVLTGALKDEYEDIRATAADALGEMGPEAKSAVPELKVALKDEEGSVRLAASKAIKKITGEEFSAKYDEASTAKK